MSSDNPILNSPYEEPRQHYATDDAGALNYERIVSGRRIFAPDVPSIPVRQGPQPSLLEINDRGAEYGTLLVNLLRREVGLWRAAGYPGTTRVTRELLACWFLDEDRHDNLKLFFAQREAIETAIWLNEVAPAANVGQHALNQLREAQLVAANTPAANLPRLAYKMATGTGKTVVMAMQILYHFLNRQEYRNDTRFADCFLVVTPGITIKNRLGVLYVDLGRHGNARDYYHLRALIPRGWEGKLGNLNSRIVITNYHAFEPRTLSGNKRSPFDGKLDARGRKQEAVEDFAQVARRVLGKLKAGSRLLILNDEAHHCYLPKAEGKAVEGEDTKEENKRAAVWFSGLVAIAERYKVEAVYDLSATPYYLSGSGYQAYTLFPWVVSDFGLIEAIESGLVKIPYLPESDTTQELTMPVLRNLYDHVRDELPRKGQKRRKADAKKEGKEATGEEPPHLPTLVKLALEKFYGHYRKDYEQYRGLFDAPPVFIVVCNNTSVSKEVYKYLAGYEQTLPEGTLRSVSGHFDLFTNYDPTTGRPLFHRFRQLQGIVGEWYHTKIRLLGYADPEYRKLITFFDPKAVCGHINRGILAANRGTDRILPVLNYYNRTGSSAYVHGRTTREVFATTKSHVNFVVADTKSWEQIAAKTLEELPAVDSYVKNAFLGFAIPYVGAEGKDREYLPDFIARCRFADGRTVNLIVEITGMSQEKAEKRWYVENRWLPAVNAVRAQHGWDEWAFVEVAGDIRDIKRVLTEKLGEPWR